MPKKFTPDPSKVTDQLLASFYIDTTLCDGFALTRGGIKIPVCRPVLAAISPFFKNCFYPHLENPDTKSGERKQVTLSCDAHIFQELLQFMYTNFSPYVRQVRMMANLDLAASPDNQIRAKHITDLIKLCRSAAQFGLEDLVEWCESVIRTIVRRIPRTVCFALNAINFDRNSCDYEDITRFFFDIIKQNPQKTLFVPLSQIEECSSSTSDPIPTTPATCRVPATPKAPLMSTTPGTPSSDQNRTAPSFGILCLSGNAMSALMDAKVLKPDYAFRAIFYWATYGVPLLGGGKNVDTTRFLLSWRWAHAKILVKTINLNELTSPFLIDCVESTDLVDQKSLFHAYREQARDLFLRSAEAKNKKAGRKRRHSSGSKSTNNSGDGGRNPKPSTRRRIANPAPDTGGERRGSSSVIVVSSESDNSSIDNSAIYSSSSRSDSE